MRIKNRVHYINMEEGKPKAEQTIPYDSATITTNISSIPEARVITNHRLLEDIEFKSGDEIYITSQVEKRESFEVKRAMYFVEKIIQDDLDSVYPKMKNEIDAIWDDLIDQERINYAGNIYSTSYSGQNRLTIGCIGFPFEYRRIRVPVTSNYRDNFSIRYKVGFMGYPRIKMDNLLSAALKDPLGHFKNFLYDLSTLGDDYMYDPTILNKFKRHRLKNFNEVKYAHRGNILRQFLTENIKKFMHSTDMLEPNILDLWNVIFDIHDLEILFSPYPVQTDQGNQGFMLIKPIYDEFEPSLINTFFQDEVNTSEYYKNEFREKTRVFMGFVLRDSDLVVPALMCIGRAQEKDGVITYIIQTDLDPLENSDPPVKKDVKNTADIKKDDGSTMKFEDIKGGVGRKEEDDSITSLGLFSSGVMPPKLPLTNIEKRKGVFPLLVNMNIHSTKKVAESLEIDTENNGSKDKDKDHNVVTNNIIDELVDYDDIKNPEDPENRAFWERYDTMTAAKFLTIQKIQDSIFGERNSSIRSFFAPYVIPGLSGCYVYDNTPYYGKVTGVVTTITPTSIFSNISFIRVIRDREKLLSTYYTFKAKGGEGILDQLDKLDGTKKAYVNSDSQLSIFDADSSKKLPEHIIGAEWVKTAIDEKRKEFKSFEDFYFEKSKNMPSYRGYVDSLKR